MDLNHEPLGFGQVNDLKLAPQQLTFDIVFTNHSRYFKESSLTKGSFTGPAFDTSGFGKQLHCHRDRKIPIHSREMEYIERAS